MRHAKNKKGDSDIQPLNAEIISLLNRFLSYLTVERGLSKNTVESYYMDLKGFFNYLATSKPLNVSTSAFTREDIVNYMGKLKDDGHSTSSVCRFVSSIKSISKFLVTEKIISEDPTENLRLPMQWERLPKALGMDDIKKLLNLDHEPSAFSLLYTHRQDSTYLSVNRRPEPEAIEKHHVFSP